MRARLTKLGAMLAALAALAVGGSALASAAGGGGSQPATAPATAQQTLATPTWRRATRPGKPTPTRSGATTGQGRHH